MIMVLSPIASVLVCVPPSARDRSRRSTDRSICAPPRLFFDRFIPSRLAPPPPPPPPSARGKSP
jgi:hypothetical protein